MSLPFFTKKTTQNKDTNRFLTVTITSESIKVLAFYKDNGSLKVIGSGKELLDPAKVRAGSIVAKDETAVALESAITSAVTDIEGDIKDVIFGVSGDLCLGIMTTIRAKRNKLEPFTNKEIDEFYEKVEEAALMQAQNEVVQINGRTDIELESVTSSNVYTKLDGQKVENLNNKTGFVIEASVFNAFVPAYHIQALQWLAKKMGLSIFAIGSGMYCLAQTIMSGNKELTDFVVMEIDGDYTNVAVVFSKGIVATRTLNIGYQHFIEGITEKMGISLMQAEKMLRSYIGGKLSSSESVIIQNALRPTLEIWLSGLELLFGEYTGVKTFASKIYVSGEGIGIPDLWSLLTENDWTKTIPFKSAPEFKKMSFFDLNHVTDSTGKISSAEWLTNAVLSLIYLEMAGSSND